MRLDTLENLSLVKTENIEECENLFHSLAEVVLFNVKLVSTFTMELIIQSECQTYANVELDR